LRSTPHQSLALSISASRMSSPTVTPTRSHRLQATFALSYRVEVPLSRSGTLTRKLIRKSRYALRRTIKQAKRQYRAKIESCYTGTDARLVWQGLQIITDCKGKHSRVLPSDTSLSEELNHFYARFEASNTEACMRTSAVPDDCVITLSVANVSKTFSTGQHSQGRGDRLITRTCALGMC
jgi:hypothetical protein